MNNTDLASMERIEKAVYQIRGEKVMLDRDLARLYGVSIGALNHAVRRNRKRFPEDFMFQLTSAELVQLNRSQMMARSPKQHGAPSRPYAFTEEGVAMLSCVLRSKCAISVDVGLMRAFAELRQMFASDPELARHLDELESKYDPGYRIVFDAIRQLMATPVPNANMLAPVRDS